MQDFRGYGKGPVDAPDDRRADHGGNGQRVQSHALILDAETHAKMAVAIRRPFRVAILDPLLTLSQPRGVTAASGYDAIAHAVETAVTLKRSNLSSVFSREAWTLLEPNFERVLQTPGDVEARRAMQLGACYAGLAIDCSMLGAAHACANPLTRHHGTTHGVALGVLLPRVIRWNGKHVGGRAPSSSARRHRHRRVRRRELLGPAAQLAIAAGLPANLRALGVTGAELPAMAEDAAAEWTGTFNPAASTPLALWKSTRRPISG